MCNGDGVLVRFSLENVPEIQVLSHLHRALNHLDSKLDPIFVWRIKQSSSQRRQFAAIELEIVVGTKIQALEAD